MPPTIDNKPADRIQMESTSKLDHLENPVSIRHAPAAMITETQRTAPAPKIDSGNDSHICFHRIAFQGLRIGGASHKISAGFTVGSAACRRGAPTRPNLHTYAAAKAEFAKMAAAATDQNLTPPIIACRLSCLTSGIQVINQKPYPSRQETCDYSVDQRQTIQIDPGQPCTDRPAADYHQNADRTRRVSHRTN